jgi:hypothetical protein
MKRTASLLSLADFLLRFLFHPEDGGYLLFGLIIRITGIVFQKIELFNM